MDTEITVYLFAAGVVFLIVGGIRVWLGLKLLSVDLERNMVPLIGSKHQCEVCGDTARHLLLSSDTNHNVFLCDFHANEEEQAMNDM